MKNALALLVGAVAAGAGFGALSHFTRDAADVSEDAVSPEFDLAAELQSLRDQNAELLQRVRALESPLETPRIAADTSFEEFKAEIRELVANSASSTPVQPVLITDVEDALTAIRREEKQTAFAQKSESRQQLQEQRLTKMTEMLGLSSVQIDDVRRLNEERGARNTEMKRVWEETRDPAAAGEMKRTNATLYREGLETVLTPSQLETLDASRSADK